MPRKPNSEKGMPTIKEIAAAAGVSSATASYVLSGNRAVKLTSETRDTVLAAADRMGYKIVIKPPKNGSAIGVMVPTLTNHYYPALIEHIQETAEAAGFRAVFCNTRRSVKSEEASLKYLYEKQVSGIIYCFTPSNTARILELSRSMPVVVIGEKNDELEMSTISLNSKVAGSIMAKHLLSLGHRHIGFITTPYGSQSASRSKRYDGFAETLEKNGQLEHFTVREAPLNFKATVETYDLEVGRKLTKELLESHPEITAVAGVCDMVAVGILSELQRGGVGIPGKISVCGFDNILISGIIPPGLTTIDHRNDFRCKQAIDLLQNSIFTGKTEVLNVEYNPTLIVRGSTSQVRDCPL